MRRTALTACGRAAAITGLAALVAALSFHDASAQTAPHPPESLTDLLSAPSNELHRTLAEIAAQPSAVASALLAEAPVVGPLFATYARGDFEPPVAIDINPDPDVVEVVIVAIPALWEFRPGVPTLVWSFNGTVPGPTIEAKVGDEVVVHFLNLIDTPGGIHWHGVEVPATMDGSHVSAPATMRGESFTYRFRVIRPGLFWYHPHHDSAHQIERGLQGAFLVHDVETEQGELGLPANEHIVVLDDVWLDATGQFAPFEPAGPVQRANYLANGREQEVDPILVVNGRTGRTLPVEPGAPLRLRMVNTANSRFMRVNVPPAESVRGPDQPSESGPGRACTSEDPRLCNHLFLIGTDGGLLEEPHRRETIVQVVDPDPTHFGLIVSDNDPDHGVMLTPGERADVVLVPTGASGELLPVEWHDWGRGRHYYFRNTSGDLVLGHAHGTYPSLAYRKLFDLLLAGEGQEPTYTLPERLRDIEKLEPGAGAPVLHLTMGHGDPDQNGNIVFWMQETAEGDGLPFPLVFGDHANQATVGETALWEVKNTSHGDHNFHPHGFMFQPISVEYVTCDPDTGEIDHSRTFVETFEFVQEKDTIRIPGPPLPACYLDEQNRQICPVCPIGNAYTILRAAVRFDDEGREDDIEAWGKTPTTERSGGWMVHCHILEHAERGMMTYFELRR